MHLRYRAPGFPPGSTLPSFPNSVPSAARPGWEQPIPRPRQSGAPAAMDWRKREPAQSLAAAKARASSPGLHRSTEYRYGPGCGPAHSSRWGRGAAKPVSNLNLHHHRHMIGGFLPAAHLLEDGLGFQRAFEARTEPDMIQTPAAV